MAHSTCWNKNKWFSGCLLQKQVYIKCGSEMNGRKMNNLHFRIKLRRICTIKVKVL